MYGARAMYEAAVEAIGKDVVAKVRKQKTPPFGAPGHNSNGSPLQAADTTAGPDRGGVRTLCACPSRLRLTPAKNS